MHGANDNRVKMWWWKPFVIACAPFMILGAAWGAAWDAAKKEAEFAVQLFKLTR